MKLSTEQKQFLLSRYNILPDQVMDATSMRRSEWMTLIKDSEYEVAAGVDPCTRNDQHTIKSKGGHCIVCKPEAISFQRRYFSEGEIYIMYSPSKNLIKVGVAASSEERESSLNNAGYGNIKDWTLKYSLFIFKAGQIEKRVHKSLWVHHMPIKHFVGNSDFASEIFSCSLKKAKEAILLAIA